MNLTQFSIERNRISLTLLAVVIVLGFSVYKTLSRDSMPPYTVRVANIVTQFPGASPERVELLVTDKIEKIAQEIPELKELSSTSRTGLSVVTVTLVDQVKPEQLQSVWDLLRRKLDDMKDLPDKVIPFLDDEGIGEVYGIVIGLTSDGYSYADMKDIADDLRDDLIKLDNAAKVEIGGIQEERVFVEFDNARLASYGLSSSRLQSIIKSTNILSSGGQINLDSERIILEPTGNYNSIEDIGNTLVPMGDGSQVVYLKDITKISKGYIDPPTQIVEVNGQQAISLHITLKDGANIVKLGEEVNEVTDAWESRLPYGLELQRLSSLDTYVDDSINNFVSNLIQSIVIVLLVMLFFLGLRTGSIIASLIPIVTITTLMIMGLLGVGLNQVTLAALIMALGMMVDNGIVVTESIMVKMEQGEDVKKAAIESCSELFTPLLISTLTTSAAFLAFFMAESTMGDITGPIFVVISIALLSSWIISLSIITLFCYFFLKVNLNKEPGFIDKLIDKLKVYYKDIIVSALHIKGKVVLGITALFIVSMFGFGWVEFVFFADSDRNMITIDINLPEGTKIEATKELVHEIDKFIADSLKIGENRPNGIVDWSSYVGKGPESYDLGYSPDEANSNYAHILVNTSDAKYNNDLIDILDQYCFNSFPDADVKVGPLGAGGGGTPIEIKIQGEDPDVLAQLSEQVKGKVSSVYGTKNVKDDWGPKSKKFEINIDQSLAQSAGVTNQDIATSLQTVLDGFNTGAYREDDKSIPIVMRSNDSQQMSLENLETLNIYAQNSGKSVPLAQVAKIVPMWQYAKIRRFDIDRTINVSSEITTDGNTNVIMKEVIPWLDEQKKNWPEGYDYVLGGDAKNTAENMGAVIQYLPLSGFIILFLLIVQFNSFRKTIIVITTIPLGVIGVVIGLLAFQQPFGFMPFLGVISLAGIVINNAIVLIDRMQIEIEERSSTQDAIIMACLQRFRPILLATFTTVLGMIPLYLSGGAMWEGMAVSIMVGLLFGTVITLVFVPSLYAIFYKVDYTGYEFDDALLKETD
ncbi:MAG: efflux RND transporter permease subunit [Flavobacteriaceae bacterium]